MSKSKGNVVVPDRDPRQVRRRRRPLARRHGPPRPRLAVRRDPDEGRPPAGDEGAQRLASSCSATSAPPSRDGVRRQRARRLRAARPARRRHRPGRRRRSRPTTTRPRSRSPRSSSGSSATTTSSWSRSARTPSDGRVDTRRPRPPSRSRCTRSCGCSRRSSPTSPKRSGRGGRTARSTGRPGRRSPTSAPQPRPTPPWSTPSPPRSPASAARSRRPRSRCAPSCRASRSPARRRIVRAAEKAESDLRSTGKITGDLVFTVDEQATELSVAAELAPTD